MFVVVLPQITVFNLRNKTLQVELSLFCIFFSVLLCVPLMHFLYNTHTHARTYTYTLFCVSLTLHQWYHQFVAVAQLLNYVQLFASTWMAWHTPLSSSISLSLLKFMSIESVMLSIHLILCCPFSLKLQCFPASGTFSMSQHFASGGQSIGDSASASVLPVTIQGWFPLELTGLISLQSKELSGVFSSTTIQKHQFFCIQPCLWSKFHIHTWLLEKP